MCHFNLVHLFALQPALPRKDGGLGAVAQVEFG